MAISNCFYSPTSEKHESEIVLNNCQSKSIRNFPLKIYLLLFVICVVFSCSKRMLINTNDYNLMIGGFSYANGKIKKLIETPYKVINDSLIKYEGEWFWEKQIITDFSRQGQITHEEIFDEDGLLIRREFYYSTLNQKIPDSLTSDFTKRSFFDVVKYKYSKETRTLFIKLYRDSILSFNGEQVYNKDFIPISMKEGKEKPDKRKYETYFKGDTILLKSSNNGKLISIQKHLLNSNKDWIWMERKYYNRNKTIEHTYSYVYDVENNWIEKKIFDLEGKLLYVYKREIEYY